MPVLPVWMLKWLMGRWFSRTRPPRIAKHCGQVNTDNYFSLCPQRLCGRIINKKSRTAPDVTLTMSHSAARPSCQQEYSVLIRVKNKFKTRRFPSLSHGRFGLVFAMKLQAPNRRSTVCQEQYWQYLRRIFTMNLCIEVEKGKQQFTRIIVDGMGNVNPKKLHA